MLKGKSSTGFEFEIDDKALNNMEFVDALADLNDENPLALSKVTELLLGKAQRKRLYDKVRDEAGTVPIEEATKEIRAIFDAVKEIKNSPSSPA